MRKEQGTPAVRRCCRTGEGRRQGCRHKPCSMNQRPLCFTIRCGSTTKGRILPTNRAGLKHTLYQQPSQAAIFPALTRTWCSTAAGGMTPSRPPASTSTGMSSRR